MNAVSQATQRWNQPLPSSVFVAEAASGRIPARMTSIPPRTIMRNTCTTEMRPTIAPMNKPCPIPEAAAAPEPPPVAAERLPDVPSITPTLSLKQFGVESRSHSSDSSMIQVENESPARTSSHTIVRPTLATTTSVRRLFSRS